MDSLLSIGTAATISILLATGLRLLIEQNSQSARLLALLFLLLSCYLSLPVVDYNAIHPILSFTMARLSSMIPAVIWLLSFRLFRESEKVPRIVWVLVLSYLVIRTTGMGLFNSGLVENSLGFYVLCVAYPQIVMIGLSVHAIFMAAAEFNADLVESRRQFRVFFVTAAAIFIILTRIKSWIVYNDLMTGVGLTNIATPAFNYLILLYAFLFAWAFFLFAFQPASAVRKLFEFPHSKNTFTELSKRRTSRAEKDLVLKIQAKMQSELAFQEPGLTVNQFARELGIHPHKLREVISGYFAFNNFNRFLNSFRVREAARLLAETSEPISAISLLVGFSSLSAFNASFKSTYGVTPSRFRLENAEHGRDAQSLFPLSKD